MPLNCLSSQRPWSKWSYIKFVFIILSIFVIIINIYITYSVHAVRSLESDDDIRAKAYRRDMDCEMSSICPV